jgi:2'-5' RNA ligase
LSELIRSFIAIEVPQDTADAIREAQQRLRLADGGWKWVNPESFHITLKFLGAVAAERLRSLSRTAAESLSGVPAFGVALRGVGAFPNAHRARVVWVGVGDGAPELAALASKVEDACAAHGFEREKRPFHAHLTLGRARRPGTSSALADAMSSLGAVEFGEAWVARVLLMKSELSRSGPIYTVLSQIPLTGGDTT